MNKLFVMLMAVCTIHTVSAQNRVAIIVKDSVTEQPLAGASLLFDKNTLLTDKNGVTIFQNIPTGLQQISCSFMGYETKSVNLIFTLTQADTIEILLNATDEALEDVIIQSTRTSRTISNSPTRVEVIDGEELDEKNNMRPANVSMLLHESTGIQVQQTSATSTNASIRVQGLDGRYTQLLKDGYANYGNFASGLSILEIPPLDLHQVEVIKGPASTLYGGGAIAGVVNFISKTPKDQFAGNFILNQSNIGQTNLGAFIAQKKKKFGYTVLGSFNLQQVYDVDRDDFSELPENENFTINPRLFFYINPSVTLSAGNSFTTGKMQGGDIQVIKGNSDSLHTYYEKNNTTRNTSFLEAEKKFPNNNILKLKQSITLFNRSVEIPAYIFKGKNMNSFTDVSFLFFEKKHTIITGLNLISDRFREENANTHNAQSFTAGVYMQDNWDITDDIKLEGGLRIDHAKYQNNNLRKSQLFVLPRISALFHISNPVTMRVSFGQGYKVPTIFTEQTEAIQYRNILPLSNLEAERSIGGTADINYRTNLSPSLSLSINQMFFYTNIRKPLYLESDDGGNYFFANAPKPAYSKGFETNLKFIYDEDIKLFVGYTYTDAQATYLDGNRFLPLLPKNKLNLILMYEKEDNFKLGFETYFTDRQYLFSGSKTPSFWEFGFMAQKTFGICSFFINFENFTDQRQSKYKTVVNEPHNNPTFDEIWNHTEGRVINGGLKIKF